MWCFGWSLLKVWAAFILDGKAYPELGCRPALSALGGSGGRIRNFQGHFPLHSRFEASLSSYHGDFTEDEKCEVENPNQTRSSLYNFTTSECLFQVQGESQEIGLRRGGRAQVCLLGRGVLPVALIISALRKDPGSAEVGKTVKEGQAWARFSPGLGVLHG